MDKIDFTFGVITGGDAGVWVNKLIDSIERQKIPNYEIIIVGGDIVDRKNVVHIPFDENIKSKWITKKKNLITKYAKYDNVVYMHDYIYLDDNWYQGFLKNGDNFKACMTVITNENGTRFRDWTLGYVILKKIPIDYRFLIPYDMTHLSKWMYFSGAYWVAKKSVMTEFPLDENRVWGQGEDSEWSVRFRRKYKFSINSNSIVHLQKQQDVVFNLPNERDLRLLNNIDSDEESDPYLNNQKRR